MLVRSVCGQGGTAAQDAMLEEAAQVSIAYERASPVAQRRFDAMAGEMAAWAAAGVEALLGSGEAPPQAPARRLAGKMENGLDQLRALLHVD